MREIGREQEKELERERGTGRTRREGFKLLKTPRE